MDPLDFSYESWDWDGSGISEFEEQYGDYIDYLVWIASEGSLEPGSLDIVWELADIFAPLIMSYYVSPDLSYDVYWWDGYEYAYLSSGDNPDNTTLVAFSPFEMTTSNPYEGLVLEFYDRDVAFDDPAGWTFLDGFILEEVVDCGPMVWLLSDAQMYEYDTRVRLVYLDVESW